MPALAPILRAQNHVLAGVVIASIPASVPVFVAPVAPPPAAKHRSVKHGTVVKFKHSFPPLRPPRKNPQRLPRSMIRIRIHRVVAYPKSPVPTRQVLQPVSDVHMPALVAILRV